MSINEKGHHPAGKKRSIYLVLVLVTFLTIVSLGMDISQNSPQFCSSCHTMKPEYYTWQASSHNRMGCLDCHRAEGVKGALNLTRDLARWTYAEVTKTYIRPIRLFRSIDDQVCFRCHSYNRQQSFPGNLIIPHEQHTDKRVRCVSCHSAVAHGDIARRGVTRKIDYADWDTDTGLQEMARSLVLANKADCMSCHYRRRVSTDCNACHGEMRLPDYHEAAGFTSNHGDEARELLADCNYCHGWTGPRKMVVDDRTSLVAYSRENRFCLSCHRVRPESHGGSIFKASHGNTIKFGGRDAEGCLVCHDNNTTDLPKATDISCASCHPAKHRKNWHQGHMPKVQPGVRIRQTCFFCHSENSCLSCHYMPGSTASYSNAPVLEDFTTLPGQWGR